MHTQRLRLEGLAFVALLLASCTVQVEAHVPPPNIEITCVNVALSPSETVNYCKDAGSKD